MMAIMSDLGAAFFETAIGLCGIVWSERGIAGAQLPEDDAKAARSRLLRRFPGARETKPPTDVEAVIADIVALLGGKPVDLSTTPLDMRDVPDFHRRVYDVARAIPPGATLTYGEIAKRLGDPGAARAVGQALGLNPIPIIVPCHRVLAASGRTGGFSANGGVTTKMRMLTIERATTSDAPSLFEALPLAAKPR